MRLTNNQQTFIGLVRAGLWENCKKFNVDGLRFTEPVDWEKVYLLAEEQSVIGLVLAGIEHANVKPPQELLLQWIGEVQMLGQQNKAMNQFIAELFEKLSKAGVSALLVKGQGVAQSYEKPLWRCSGDIDLLMDGENYERAKELLVPIAEHVETENVGKKHLGLYIKDFLIELHGAMPFEVSKRVDTVLDDVTEKAYTCHTNGTNDLQYVAIPKVDEHLMIVFTHFLNHFCIEGVGLRQVCDWCRLLWTYKDSLNYGLLETRIKRMGLMTEWQAFASLAVDVLGMPKEAMPMYDSRFKVKGERILERIMKSGNMGHNNDLSYRAKYSGLTYKLVALWRRMKDFAGFTMLFPIDAPRFFVYYVLGRYDNRDKMPGVSGICLN